MHLNEAVKISREIYDRASEAWALGTLDVAYNQRAGCCCGLVDTRVLSVLVARCLQSKAVRRLRLPLVRLAPELKARRRKMASKTCSLVLLLLLLLLLLGLLALGLIYLI